MRAYVPATKRVAALTAILALAACGGGGSDESGGDGRPTVASVGVSGAMYSRTALVTVNGTNLSGTNFDPSTITVAWPGCTGMTRSTTAPNASTATTAYYTCTVKAVGAQTVTVTRTADGSPLATRPVDVPMPQVTMTVGNGAAVSGSMVITLAPDKTPITVDNFLRYVNDGFYNGTIYHRVVSGFVIQGGGYLPITSLPATPKAPTYPPIALEVGKGLSNVQWTIAMARTTAPDSATSQFFINLVNNAAILDPGASTAGYAVFGSVTGNTALVSAIAGAPCLPISGFSECAPNPNMVISKAEQTR